MNTWKKLKQIDWTQLQHLGIIGFLGLFWIPVLKWFFLFYLIGFIQLFKGMKEAEKESNIKNLNNYYLTFFLSQLNPFVFFPATLQGLGQIVILLKNITGLPDRDNYQNKTDYILPFQGQWFVANGGSTKKNSHSWDILTQRYAYDFIIVDPNKKSFEQEGKSLRDYYCYEKEVLAPADGRVVTVSDRVKDYTGVGDLSLDWKTRDFRGNFVIIQHADKEFSFLAHFKSGSIRVQKGQQVRQGEVIGLCGNSGHSTEPHIHFHLQDNATIWIATGLPIRFKKVLVTLDGEQSMVRTHDFIEKNEKVENLV
ncbi:M23 family metallopeptidase [Cytophagaceae bacterium DM2B3-1]|uniref:M23 family metallopeptidase n=1 Tax=Xanthocytophaga flava TaxID=3048013 RepID=A0ABT7CY76_9BACT|nr:M23 family metallopeptidase [Xanthocytophaga flavus]MDJ1498724.1 M23 family metallopeptidase [Xanthocytophaga flavus]